MCKARDREPVSISQGFQSVGSNGVTATMLSVLTGPKDEELTRMRGLRSVTMMREIFVMIFRLLLDGILDDS
jgi:hypothetical protein